MASSPMVSQFLISPRLAAVEKSGLNGLLLNELGRRGLLISNLKSIQNPRWLEKLSETGGIEEIRAALDRVEGDDRNEPPEENGRYVEIKRPVRLPGSQEYATARLKLFEPEIPHPKETTVVAGGPMRFVPPPEVPLDDEYMDPLHVLQILEYAGVPYLSPECPAAELGIRTFLAGREFALETDADWVGFDWDFTAGIYRIYTVLGPLISATLFGGYIRVLEAAKPGAWEYIMGTAVGYAKKQGLERFDQWEKYRPQVLLPTQTWGMRLKVLGNEHSRLIPLLMGRLPGLPISEEEVADSKAFITSDDFLPYTERLLHKLPLSPSESKALAEIFKIKKGHVLKPLGAFEEKGLTPPKVIFDDSPKSNDYLREEGVQVVGTYNPLAPGGEMSSLKAITFRGRKAAARQMVEMASRTEASAFIEAAKKLLAGEKEITIGAQDLQPIPQGTILVIHDTKRPIDKFKTEFLKPRSRVKKSIRRAATFPKPRR